MEKEIRFAGIKGESAKAENQCVRKLQATPGVGRVDKPWTREMRPMADRGSFWPCWDSGVL